MKHRQSGKKLIVRLFCVMIAATLLCFVVCGVYSLRSVQKELRYCNEAALDVFFQGLQFIAEDLEDFGELIYEKSSLFSMLDLQSISIEQRSAAEMSLRQLCRSRTTACTAIYLFQRGDGFRFYSVGEAFLGNNVLTADTVKTMAAVRTFWESQESDSLQRWVLFDSDSAAVEIPITQKRYDGEDYRAYVSGYEPNLDSIFVFPKTTVIHERSYKPPNKWHIGITGGYGYGFKSKQAEPYIGIGITYSLISFAF